MYIFRSIHEIINTIAAARGLLTEMFEKRKTLSFRYSDALALLKDDENRLKLLIEKEDIRQNGNFVELDARFLDFFELAFIIVPLLGPVAEKLGIDLIWFGVLLGINMQTSFMHPPFGFALFFLRSVAPASVKTSDIYWGAIPFVCIQIIMVGLVIAIPEMVTFGLDKPIDVDLSTIQMELPETHYDEPSEPPTLPGAK